MLRAAQGACKDATLDAEAGGDEAGRQQQQQEEARGAWGPFPCGGARWRGVGEEEEGAATSPYGSSIGGGRGGRGRGLAHRGGGGGAALRAAAGGCRGGAAAAAGGSWRPWTRTARARGPACAPGDQLVALRCGRGAHGGWGGPEAVPASVRHPAGSLLRACSHSCGARVRCHRRQRTPPPLRWAV